MNLPISIRGARQHNLRNLDLDLPSNKHHSDRKSVV